MRYLWQTYRHECLDLDGALLCERVSGISSYLNSSDQNNIPYPCSTSPVSIA